MKLNELVLVGDTVEALSRLTSAPHEEIIRELTGVCFSEEDAGQVRRYLIDDDDVPEAGA